MNEDIKLGPFESGEFEGKEVIIEADSFVKYGDQMIGLCPMCQLSRMTCENDYVRDTLVPLDPGDDPNLGLVRRRQDDGTMKDFYTGFKMVDGVEAGIFTSENDIPTPFICIYFKPKVD